jgi:hypothetical protein
MRSFITTIIVALFSVGSWAQEIDKSALEKQIQQLEQRVARLEAYVSTLPGVEPSPEVKKMMEYAQLRMAMDKRVFSRKELGDIEALYQSAAKNLGSFESEKLLQMIVTQYPKSNRAGCAQLYAARYNKSGKDQERLLKDCIARFGDCYYGDGTQVGPFAMLNLANYYENAGKTEKAKALYDKIRKEHSDAVMHDGHLLVSEIK